MILAHRVIAAIDNLVTLVCSSSFISSMKHISQKLNYAREKCQLFALSHKGYRPQRHLAGAVQHRPGFLGGPGRRPPTNGLSPANLFQLLLSVNNGLLQDL
jgi:hypothetical protein